MMDKVAEALGAFTEMCVAVRDLCRQETEACAGEPHPIQKLNSVAAPTATELAQTPAAPAGEPKPKRRGRKSKQVEEAPPAPHTGVNPDTEARAKAERESSEKLGTVCRAYLLGQKSRGVDGTVKLLELLDKHYQVKGLRALTHEQRLQFVPIMEAVVAEMNKVAVDPLAGVGA